VSSLCNSAGTYGNPASAHSLRSSLSSFFWTIVRLTSWGKWTSLSCGKIPHRLSRTPPSGSDTIATAQRHLPRGGHSRRNKPGPGSLRSADRILAGESLTLTATNVLPRNEKTKLLVLRHS
jgi:hypothetical protein